MGVMKWKVEEGDPVWGRVSEMEVRPKKPYGSPRVHFARLLPGTATHRTKDVVAALGVLGPFRWSCLVKWAGTVLSLGAAPDRAPLSKH